MGQNFCPQCGEAIAPQQINIGEGVALCAACGKLSRLADVVAATRPVSEILRRIPRGCSVTDRGHKTVVRATLRSPGAFLGSLAMAVFWNGIVSVFLLVAAAGLYTNLIGPLPPWFPAPDFEQQMTLGMTLFLCVFLTPFVLVGTAMLGAVILSAAGAVEVHIGGTEGQVRTGVGPLAWRRAFDPEKVHRVSMGRSSWEHNGEARPVIVIESDHHVKFGSMLAEPRREWLRAVLHVLLVNSGAEQHAEILRNMNRSF